jgi:hypothetical protein
MIVDETNRNRIVYFIYAYETFDVKEISSNLLDIPLREIEAVVNEDFERISREIEYKE